MRKIINKKTVAAIIYAALIIVLTFAYFTNDFGLVDIRKTAIIVGVGIDVAEGDSLNVTAQVAVPQPSSTGESTSYTLVSGDGATVAEALKDVNVKLGFYPKLLFCKLILLGESCKGYNIFGLLDYFYHSEYTQLTPIVAMCQGSAADLLAEPMPYGDSTVASIERLLSDEAKKAGNVATVNLKCIGINNYSPSNACHMPYIMAQSKNPDGQSEYTCNRTAAFAGGNFVGLLGENQAYALNLLVNQIRHTFVAVELNGENFTIGLRSCKGGAALSFSGDKPKLTLTFSAKAKVTDSDKPLNLNANEFDGSVKSNLKSALTAQLKDYMVSLINFMLQNNCDLLNITQKLYTYHPQRYNKLSSTPLQSMTIDYNIKII